ncbi:MAG: hypothetical protein ABI183_06820 [Polyangiaceae bacterium]
MMKNVLLIGLLLIVGCGSSSKKSGAIPPGPNYSATPCADNCGADATCNAGCTPLGAPGTQQPINMPGH